MDLSSEAIANMAAFVLQASLKATVLVALVLLAQRVLGKVLPANWRYLLWFTVVIALVTPVGYEAALLPATDPPAAAVSASMNEPVTVARQDLSPPRAQSPISSPARPARMEQPVMTQTLPRSWPSLLPYAWLAGVLAVFGAIAVSSRRFARIVRRAHPVSTSLRDLLQDCRRVTACASHVEALESAEVDVPMIAGQFSPVLLLPEGLERQLTGEQLRHVFIHELMHLQRGDIAGNWLVAIAQALHWFNPVVWFAFSRMRQDRELACDAATMRHLAPAERAAYGYTLLQLNDTAPGARIPAPALGMLTSHSHLKRRIQMLARNSQRSTLGRIVTALVVLPLAALAFSQPVPAARDMPAAASAAVSAESAPAPVPAAPVQLAQSTSTQSAAPTAVAAPAPAVEPAPEVILSVPAEAASAPPAPGQVSSQPEAPRAAVSADPFAAPAPAAVVAATSAEEPAARVAADAEQEAPVPVDMAALDELMTVIAEAKPEGIGFVEKWNAMGVACDARKDGFLGALSANCQRIRTAQRRGEIFRFAYTCYQLNTWRENLEEEYGAVETLRTAARDLDTFCNKDTYSERYPAFASIFADAEALKYYPRRNPNETDLARSRNLAALYRGYGTTTTSMFTSESGNSFTMGPYEPSYNVQPNGWATGTVDPGWNQPTGGGEAPVAPQ